MSAVMPGTIVLLNGTSSSGKTSIVRALQARLNEPWLHTGIDEYAPRLPAKFTSVTGGPDPVYSNYTTLVYDRPTERKVVELGGVEFAYGEGQLVDVHLGPGAVHVLAARYRGMAATAAAGVNLAIDDVIFDPRVLRAAVDAFADSDALFVGLRLPLEVAEQREQARGDRGPGGARLFHERVHAHGLYDLELDTSMLTPNECAQRIAQALAAGQPRGAMQALGRAACPDAHNLL
jgi:chloramphenicol 3-O phosphotransferase